MPTGDRGFSKRFDEKQEREKRFKAGLPGEDEPKLPPPVEPIKGENKEIGRNDPCPCGSGKKYKKCCGKETPKP